MTATVDDYIWGSVRCSDNAFLHKAEAEPVLEPDLPIIDTHLHLWHHFDNYPYFVPQHARDIAESGHNVIASIFVECNTMYRKCGPGHLKWVGETEFAVGQAAMAESRKYTTSRIAQGIVGRADLRLGTRVQETLEAHVEAANGRFRGIRQRAKWDGDPLVKGRWSEDEPHLYLDSALSEGLKRLTEMGLSFDASIYHPQIPDVTAMARAHPNANIILIHSASPVGHGSYAGKEAENHASWYAWMKELATCPNVSVKMGGILMNVASFDFTKADRPPTSAELAELWRPYIEPCIELFGAERCMVSSNFPVDKAGFPYRTVWNMFKRITSGCSDDEKRLLYSETAKRIYRLD
jgi:predicted TIM-barrel fold metal-dependent hydrolase